LVCTKCARKRALFCDRKLRPTVAFSYPCHSA